jgi:SAM-dependent methyltransferase
MNATTPYLLDNAQTEAARRMRVLAHLYDATTRRVLSDTGIGDGWSCLEIGGGGGSVAHWMAERVAPGGSVLCTDLDPRHIAVPQLPNLRIERHDIVRDDLPAAHFHLIHARLVLIHLPERDQVLERLVAALRPGGWLVIEDFDVLSLLPDREVNPCEVALPTADAMRTYMARGGVDARSGRLLHGKFRALGLAQVAAEGRLVMLDLANGGADLMRVNFEQVGGRLIAAGLIDAEQLQRDLARLDDADYAAPSPIMWSVRGRRASLDAASAAQQA